MSVRIYVASAADRDDLVVEVAVADEIFCEVTHTQPDGRVVIEIFQRASGSDWTWDFDELLRALEAARARYASLMM